MKRIFRFLLTACAVSALAVSCDFVLPDKDDDYKGAAAETGAQVYFSNENSTSMSLSPTATSFKVKVDRIETSSALSVGILADVPTTEVGTPYFDVPSTVSFAAGQSETELEVAFDPEVLGFDNKQTLTLSISDKTVTTPYGSDQMSFTVNVPAPWKSIGKGKITDNWWPMGTSEIEIMQNEVDPSQFKLVKPFGSTESPVIKVLKPGDTLEGVTITKSDLVYFDDIYLVYYSNYDAVIYICHPSGWSSMKDESKWTYSHVMEYQENGLPARIQIAGMYYMYGVGGWNNSQADGNCYIDFPGYEPKDFTFSMTREGTFYDLDEKPYAVAGISFGPEPGAASDIAYIAAACVKTADQSEALNAVLNGEVETVTVNGDGSVNLPMSGESGDYTIIAVAYDENGEAQEYMAATFEYFAPGASNPWESIGFCPYTEDIVGPWFGADVLTYYVEVLKNTEKPGMYRMVHPYGADYPYNDEGDYDTATHYFEINATDPDAVWFDDQNLGVDWSYGTMHAYSLYYAYISNGYTPEQCAAYAGKLADGKITFPTKALYVYDTGGNSNYANTNGKFCLDLSSPLAERPESSTSAAPAAVRSMFASNTGLMRPHSRGIGVNRTKGQPQQF